MNAIDAYTEEEARLDFVPVIFANGADDDLPGLVAAYKNERVQYGERIYGTGERIEIADKSLCLSCNQMHVFDEEGGRVALLGVVFSVEPNDVVVTAPMAGRSVEISACGFFMNRKAI